MRPRPAAFCETRLRLESDGGIVRKNGAHKEPISVKLPLELKGDIACRSPVSIHQVVRGRIGAVRYIVQKRSKEVPDLADWIKIRFTIAPSGAVVAVSFVGHGTGDRELDGQIKDKVRNWPFDPVEKGSVVVTYYCVLRDR